MLSVCKKKTWMDGWSLFISDLLLKDQNFYIDHWSETLKLFSPMHQPPGSPWTQITYFQPNYRWKAGKRGAAPRPPSRSPVGERLRLGGAQCPSSNSDRFHARIFRQSSDSHPFNFWYIFDPASTPRSLNRESITNKLLNRIFSNRFRNHGNSRIASNCTASIWVPSPAYGAYQT